jgi:hypothetical protein
LHLQCNMCQTQRPMATAASVAIHSPLPVALALPPSSLALASHRPDADSGSVDMCLHDLASRLSEHLYAEVTALLARLLEKVTKHPQETKFRKISLEFPLIHKTLGAFKVHSMPPVRN